MRISHKLLLVAATALAAMAVTAGSASAVEVSEEVSGTPCGTGIVVCPLEAHGEVELIGFPFGVETMVADCLWELSGTIAVLGEGSITGTNGFLDHPGTNSCVEAPCGLPWPVHIDAGGATGLMLSTELCITGFVSSRCAVTLPITESGHNYSWIGHVQGTAHTGPACGIEGHLIFEDQAIEIESGAPLSRGGEVPA